jgi:hypothetical protein
VHESCGAHASGLGAESTSTANTRREISLLMNRMTYSRKQIYRNENGNGKRKSRNLVREYIPIQRGKWESREVSYISISRLTSIIYSTAQTGGICASVAHKPTPPAACDRNALSAL